MKLHILFLCITLQLIAAKPKILSRIVGGQEARVGQFPWQAAVYIDANDGTFFCGGSLIDNQWILTAAHCIYNAKSVTIHLGSNTLESPDPNRVTLATSTFVMFPNFDPDSLEHDIGLIKLHMSVVFNDYIQPIPLATIGETVEGAVSIISGWGQISDETSGIVDNLYYANVLVISNEECKKTYGDQIKSTMICSLGNYNEGICTGDTGGPLVMSSENRYIQIGISGFFSQEGCETLHPSGYIRTDIYKVWVENVTQSE